MGVSKGPWTVNGQSPLGHRIDALGEEHDGLAFLENPVGYIKKIEDADYACTAVNEREDLTKKLDRVGVLFQEVVQGKLTPDIDPWSRSVEHWIDRLSAVLRGDPTVTVHCVGPVGDIACEEFEVPLDEFLKADRWQLPTHNFPSGARSVCSRSGSDCWKVVVA